MAKKLEEDMMKQRMSQPEQETPASRISELAQRPSSKGSKSRAHTDSGSFERHERAVAGIKAEVKRESKTPKLMKREPKVINVKKSRAPMKRMKKPVGEFDHLKLGD